MAEKKISHPTYKIVSDEEADAFGWVFTGVKENMTKIGFKFPEIKPNELRANITYTGLCHSDLHIVTEEWGPAPFPLVPGHEICGVVTALGSDVKGFEIGEPVAFGVLRETCGECEPCKADQENLCNGKVEQKYTYDKTYWGGYATALQQPAAFFYKIPKNLPVEKVPPLLCAGITLYNPIKDYCKPGQEVAVIGVGGLGHLGVQYAKAWGCRVTGVTSSEDKKDFIKKLGADDVFVSTDENLEKYKGKFHVVLNTISGSQKLTGLVWLTRPLGTFVQLGLPPSDQPPVFDPAPLVHCKINYVGSETGSRKVVKEMLEFSSKNNIVSMCEQFEFNDFGKAFDVLKNGKPKFRCVVDCTKSYPKNAQKQ